MLKLVFIVNNAFMIETMSQFLFAVNISFGAVLLGKQITIDADQAMLICRILFNLLSTLSKFI